MWIAIGVAGILSVDVLNARADLEVGGSFSIHAEADFHAPLAVHGTWIEVGSYGRCWRPAHIAVEWRPYCYGHWVWSDCGWFWESDEPWGWACYHYGRWVWESDYGWIWIPGVEWAPAWVEWRVGGGYIGWAPLAPAHVTIAIGAPRFVFVPTPRFHERLRPSTVIVNNTTIINNTTVINNVRHETRSIAGAGSQKVVINEGPGVDVVRKATGKTVKVASIRKLADDTAPPAEVRARSRESKAKGKTATAPPDQPNPASKQKAAPVETREQPGKPKPPKIEQNPQQKRQQPAFAPPAEKPKPVPEQRPPQNERREPPGKATPHGSDQNNKQRPPDRYASSPGNVPPNVQPPAKPAPSEGRKGKGKKPDKNPEPKAGGNDKL